MWIVGVILYFRERQELRTRRGDVRRGLSEVYFRWRLGEGDGVIEGGVAPGVGHPREPGGGGLEHARLERREGGARLGRRGWADSSRGRGRGWGGMLPPHTGLVTSQLGLGHEALVVARVEAARIVVPGVSAQSLVHQLVTVAVAVHLGPVVPGLRAPEVAQRSHARGWVGGAGGHYRRPLVRPVRVLLHVLGQVGLLGVGLATVRTNVCL